MKAGTTHNFHLPLPTQLYERLRKEAERRHKPATQLVKQAVEYWLEQQEQLALHEEIAAYAANYAGTAGDLDETLADAALEHLAETEKK